MIIAVGSEIVVCGYGGMYMDEAVWVWDREGGLEGWVGKGFAW